MLKIVFQNTEWSIDITMYWINAWGHFEVFLRFSSSFWDSVLPLKTNLLFQEVEFIPWVPMIRSSDSTN